MRAFAQVSGDHRVMALTCQQASPQTPPAAFLFMQPWAQLNRPRPVQLLPAAVARCLNIGSCIVGRRWDVSRPLQRLFVCALCSTPGAGVGM